MASLTDLLAKTVASATQGVEIPSNVQGTVLNGLSDSVLKSLTQTATAPGGVEVLKDMDGDGDVDLNDIILSLSGAQPKQQQKKSGGLLGSVAGSILGGILKGK